MYRRVSRTRLAAKGEDSVFDEEITLIANRDKIDIESKKQTLVRGTTAAVDLLPDQPFSPSSLCPLVLPVSHSTC